jgi:hypothetical protein
MSDTYVPVLRPLTTQDDEDTYKPVLRRPSTTSESDQAETLGSIRKLDPQADDKLLLTKYAAPLLGLSPQLSYAMSENIAQKLYGHPAVKAAASKLSNYITNTQLDAQINRIHGLYPLGPLPPEAQKQVDDLEKQKQGNTLEGIPKFAADVVSGLTGFVGGLGQKLGFAGQALSEDFQGIVAAGLQGLGVDHNPGTAEYHFNMGAQAAREFTAVGIGAYKKRARAAGQGEVSSLIEAEVMDLGNTLMLTMPAGRAKDAAEVAFANVVGKTGLRGGLTRVGQAVTKQTAIAATVSAWNNMVEQFGTELSNVAEKTNIPLKTLQQQVSDIGMGTAQMAPGGLVLEGAGALVGHLQGIADRASKAEPSPNAQEGAAKPSEAPKAEVGPTPEDEARQEAVLNTQAKTEVDAMPIDDLEKETPYEDVPRGTTEAKFTPIGEQVEADPRVVKARQGTEEGRAAMQKSLDEEQAKENPDSMRVDALRKAIDSSDSNLNTVRNRVYEEKFVENYPKAVEARKALADALNDPTQSDRVTGLAEALNSAQKEAKMMAAERGRIRVAKERARVARLEDKHKAIGILKSVDPDIFDKSSGDAIRAIQEHFEAPKKTGKAEPEPTVLDLDALKSALAEAKAAHEDIAPEVQDALNGMPSTYSKLSADQLQSLVAVVKNLDTIRKLQGKIRTAEGWAKRADLQADAEKSIAPPKSSLFGKEAATAKRKAKALARTATNSFSMNGELVFGGKSTLTHRVAIQDVLNSRGDFLKENTRQQEATRSYLRDTLKIDERRTPLKWQNYWNEKFSEDGVTLTRAEIMDNYMSFQNKNQRASLIEDGTAYASHITDEGNPADVEKLSEATYQKFFAHLGETEHRLMDVANNQLKENGPSLSQYHENRYGTPTKLEENYWPKYVKREGASYDKDITDIQNENRYLSTNPDESSLITRTGAKGATYTTGFWQKFSESTENSSRILKMGNAVSSSAKVLYDSKIADRIAKTYGGAVLKQLREDLATEAGQRETPKEIDRGLDMLGNVATNLHLGIVSSLRVPVKLLGLGIRSFINNPHGFFPAVMDIIIHPKNASKAARSFSSMVDEAYKHGGTVDLGQLTRYASKSGKVRAVGRKIQSLNMTLTRGGSNLGFVWDATAARHEAEYQFNRALRGKQMDSDFKAITGVTEDKVKGGLTPEEKLSAVGKYADNVIGESHAVNDPGYRIGLQKTAVGRLVTKFKTEPLKGFEQIRRLTMRFARNPNLSNAGKLFSALTIYAVLEGALIYGIDEGVNALFSVKTKTKQTLGETERATDLSMIPLVGDAVNEHLYLAQHPWVSAQQNAVESIAVLPLNTVLDTIIMSDSQYTQSQRNAATKRVIRDMKSIFNVPLNIANMENQ